MSAEIKSGQIEVIQNWLDAGAINFIGMPFAGKDAHAAAIGELIDAPVIGGGQILRAEVETLSDDDRQIMEAGGLVSSSTFCDMVLHYFSRPEFANRPIMLSAVGRSDGEQLPTMEAAKLSGHPIKRAVIVDITFKEAAQRWEESRQNGNRGSRQDDTYEAFLERFEWFKSHTLPVIDTYVELGLATQVDGRDRREEVTRAIVESLVAIAAS